jgi:murein DD-endopeptidase MepM/ murein hydrolase activator NlpD
MLFAQDVARLSVTRGTTGLPVGLHMKIRPELARNMQKSEYGANRKHRFLAREDLMGFLTRRLVTGSIIVLFLVSLLPGKGEAISSGPFLPHRVWPISGTTKPDFPLSSTFGPRLKASEGYRYDFHRGIDIPAPRGTAVRAIADGVVRLAGDYPFYSDTLVQIRHYRPKSGGRCTNNDCYYSNYMHLSMVSVEKGQKVKRGQTIGYSGVSHSGFEHLHFEIRDGGIHQKHCIHPLVVLPYEDRGAPQVKITTVSTESPAKPKVGVTVTSKSHELDFNRVEVFIYKESFGNTLYHHAYDTMRWNQRYTPINSPDVFMDDWTFNEIEVHPAPYSASSETYRVDFSFFLQRPTNVDEIVVKVRVEDVRGNSAEATFP